MTEFSEDVGMRAGMYDGGNTLWHWINGGRRSIVIPRSVFLPDVSYYQGVIDWAKMKAAGVHGVIIRAGQAGTIDKEFDNNWRGARANGIPRGSYWFYDSRAAPKAQAALWWGKVGSDKGELLHVLDLEENYGGAYGGWGNWKVCLDEFRRLSGGNVKLGIYTGYYYWTSKAPVGTGDLQYFASYPLWLAWYASNPAYVVIPKPWTSLILWQYGTTPPKPAAEYGVKSLELDSNNFNGDAAAYRKYFGLDAEPPAPPPPGTAGRWQVVSAALNVRSGPGTSHPVTAPALLRNDIIEGAQDVGTMWIRIAKILRGAQVILPTGAWWCSGLPAYVTPLAPPATKTVYRWYMDDEKIGEKETS
jgi:lysozyme